MTILTIEDMRIRARKRLPLSIFDYIDGGSGDDLTLAANRAAFSSVSLQPRRLVDIPISQKTTILGQHVEIPAGLGPSALPAIFARNGEIAESRAARAEGVGFALSAVSVKSMEEVSSAVGGDFWFQLYVMRDRGLTEALVERARGGMHPVGAHCRCADPRPRERDLRNGQTAPPKIMICPPLTGPETMIVWTTKGTLNAEQEAQAGRRLLAS